MILITQFSFRCSLLSFHIHCQFLSIACNRSVHPECHEIKPNFNRTEIRLIKLNSKEALPSIWTWTKYLPFQKLSCSICFAVWNSITFSRLIECLRRKWYFTSFWEEALDFSLPKSIYIIVASLENTFAIYFLTLKRFGIRANAMKWKETNKKRF